MHQIRAILATCAVAISITLVISEQAVGVESMFVFVQEADSPGNDYSRTDHSSFERCELSCERDVACNAFTYNQIKGECFLKKAPAQWTTIRLGAITGIKLSPVQLPSKGEGGSDALSTVHKRLMFFARIKVCQSHQVAIG